MALAALLELLGGVLVAVGLALAWLPLGVIFAGAALIALGNASPGRRPPGPGEAS